MGTSIFFKGLVIGFLISIPVGPIGLLCVQRALTKGKTHGLVSGLGAATADAFYGSIAIFGLTFISNFLIKEQVWFRLIGGVFLCCLGVKTFLSKSEKQAAPGNSYSHAGDYGSIFLLTLMNPMTILIFAAMFTGLCIVSPGTHYTSASLLIGGIFVGSGLWWVMLSSAAGMFREKLSYSRLTWLNKLFGIIITTFGLLVILSLKI